MTGRLDYQAAERVLEAVKAAGLEPPAAAWPSAYGGNQLDTLVGAREWRSELAYDVSWAYTLHAIAPDLESDARSRRRTKNLAAVSRLANRLLTLILDDDMPLDADIGRQFDLRAGESIHRALTGLRGIAVASHHEVTRRRDVGISDQAILAHLPDDGPSKMGTAVDFVSCLAEIFERRFGEAATLTYDAARQPDGPFLAFALSVVNEMQALGHPPPVGATPGAIEQAFKRGRRLSDNLTQK